MLRAIFSKQIFYVAFCAWALAGLAHAEPLPFEALAKSGLIGRYLIEESPQLERVFSALTRMEISSAEARAAAFGRSRALLSESKLSDLRKRIEDHAQAVVQNCDGIKIEGELTPAHKRAINVKAARLLDINPSWRLKLDSPASDFFTMRAAERYAKVRDKFLDRKKDPVFSKDNVTLEEAPLEQKLKATEQVKADMARMRECVAKQGASEERDRIVRYTLRQLVMDEGFQMAGAVIAAGSVDDLDWKNLPWDLVEEAILSVGESLFASVTPSKARGLSRSKIYWMRVRRTGAWGVGVAGGLDSVFYYVAPDSAKDTHGASNGAATASRFAYSTAYHSLYAPVSVLLADLIAGLECVGASKGLVIAVQGTASLGLSTAYFGVRRETPLPGLNN